MQRELEGLLERLGPAGAAERRSLGERIRLKFGRLVAEHLLHMEREETSGNRVLWANYSDDALRALHQGILGAIPPARMLAWAALMVPALSAPEAQLLLGAVERQVPPDLAGGLAGLRAEARLVHEADDGRLLAAALGSGGAARATA
jgi:hypothetical protein